MLLHEVSDLVVEWIRALDSSSRVSDQQSVGSSPGGDSCNLKARLFFIKLRPSDGMYITCTCKAVYLVCCNAHEGTQCTLIKKNRGSPQCFWSDWLHIAQQHLVNHYTLWCCLSQSHTSKHSSANMYCRKNSERQRAMSVTE